MSSNELLPLFPSALHPALPIASQILSTLRNLTAPGRGNDVRAEERAALVGVAALLGCERVQSKDLVESSAQKASSVSPAHFRSALSHARRILKTVSLPTLDASSSRRTLRRSNSSNSPIDPTKPNKTDQSTTLTDRDQDGDDGSRPAPTPSPFATPKKKFKYTSGIDVTDLIRSTHKNASNKGGVGGPGGFSPAESSPLRHSVTPSKRPVLQVGEDDIDQIEERDDGDDVEMDGEAGDDEANTPTKRNKYAMRPGIDLARAYESVRPPASLASGPGPGSTKRKGEDVSSFFALRPGSGNDSSPLTAVVRRRFVPVEDGLPEVRTRRGRQVQGMGMGMGTRSEKKLVKMVKRDGRYPEVIWGGVDVVRANGKVLDEIWTELPKWLEEHDCHSRNDPTPTSLEEILLPTEPIAD